jgi:hypothetical protein
MSANEIIPIHVTASEPRARAIPPPDDASLVFELFPLRFRFASTKLREFSPNAVRGALGSALKKNDPAVYGRYFAPKRQTPGPNGPTGSGELARPSGFADPPRPFVLRVRESCQAGLNIFSPDRAVAAAFQRAMAELGEIESIDGASLLRIDLAPPARAINRLRVRFVTPTELKGADRPEFGILLSRIRDRISTLRALWGPGPLALDFKTFGERAARVRMSRCDLEYVAAWRMSRATGQRHSLGGFTGIAEYEAREGDLAEFLPYLEAARWTGAGRQTVWGKGELHVEEI